MRLIVTNPALNEALLAQGKDWKTFTRQEMRTVVCGELPRGVLLQGRRQVPDVPLGEWHATSTRSWRYYTQNVFKDWDYPGTGTPMLKAQHPEFETYTADSTHYLAGVACADCHMPYAARRRREVLIARYQESRCSTPTWLAGNVTPTPNMSSDA